jgi:hypothetical protein
MALPDYQSVMLALLALSAAVGEIRIVRVPQAFA